MDLTRTIVWDDRFYLPLFPRYGNPNLYCAYFTKRYKLYVEPQYKMFADLCAEEFGLYRKYPDSGDLLSHDEMIGMAYMSVYHASAIYQYLKKNKGFYGEHKLKNWKYRFYWLNPWLKECCGKRLSLFDQVCWSIYCLSDAISLDKGMSGHLMIWLMSKPMKTNLITGLAVTLWSWVMKKKGITEDRMFSEYFNKFDERFLSSVS